MLTRMRVRSGAGWVGGTAVRLAVGHVGARGCRPDCRHPAAPRRAGLPGVGGLQARGARRKGQEGLLSGPFTAAQ